MKPKIYEVKQYFENADIVKSEFDLNFSIGKIFKYMGGYSALDKNNKAHSHTIWSKDKGYAEILTYK